MKNALVAAALMALAGCASVPTHYYTLDMAAEGRIDPPVNVAIGHITVADYLAGKNVAIKAAPTRIEYYATAQWAGRLDELLTEKLRAELGPRRKDRKTVVVEGVLRAFEQVDRPEGAEAHLKFAAAFREAGSSRYDAPLAERIYSIREPAEKASPEAVAAALTRCVEILAGRLAEDAARL